MSRQWISIALVGAVILVMAAVILSARPKANQSEWMRLSKECTEALAEWNGPKTDSLATLLLDYAGKTGSQAMQAEALFYLGTYRDDVDSADMDIREQRLLQAEGLASQLNDAALLSRIYNSRGVWELSRRRNYYTSRELFLQALRYARTGNLPEMEVKVEANISESCRLLGDTLGIAYDRELFEHAIRTNDEALAISAGLHCAEYVAGIALDTLELKRYAEPLLHSTTYYSYVPTLYAAYWFSSGNYGKALEVIQQNDSTPWHQTWLLKARILNALNQPEASNEIIDDLLSENRDAFYDDIPTALYGLRALNNHMMGRFKEAYADLSASQTLADSLRLRREDDKLRWLKIEFEVDKKNEELAERREREHRMRIAIWGILILTTIAGATYAVYDFRRRRHYREIVLKNRAFITHESELMALNANLQKELEKLRKQSPNTPVSATKQTAQATVSVSSETAEAIYAKIRHEVEDKQIWRDKTITRETFADRIGCNRTYFSEVIKMKTGMSYSSYMNQLRINEAVRILSDPGEAETVALRELSDDLGFLSVSTFYSSFKKIVGMTPAAYKKTSGELN